LGKINYLLNKQTNKQVDRATQHLILRQTALNISLHDLLQNVCCSEFGHNMQSEATEGYSDLQQQAQKLNEVMKVCHT
jgi:hypothetical protein